MWYFRTVQTVWYFRTVQRVWYLCFSFYSETFVKIFLISFPHRWTDYWSGQYVYTTDSITNNYGSGNETTRYFGRTNRSCDMSLRYTCALFICMVIHQYCTISSSGAGPSYPSGAPGFLCCSCCSIFRHHCFSFCHLSFFHCIVSPLLLLLPVWQLQSFPNFSTTIAYFKYT